MKRSGSSQIVAAKDREVEIQQIIEILHKWGIHTLGQLAALDKEQLGIRLGPEAVRMWERASGKSERLVKLVRPPESFDESFEFENEIETAEPLLFMLRRFLEQLSLRLSAIYLVAKELTLRITFSNKQNYERVFKIPQPTNDVDLLFRMLHTHLENFKSGHPIIAVSLQPQPIKAASQQYGLFETTLRNPKQLSETLARLTALLARIASERRSWKKRIGPMHFGWSRSRGILQPTRLPLQKRSHAWRYVGFDGPHPRRFSVPKIHRRIFEAQRSIAKSQSSAALIWLREIGGMKRHGFARNGIYNWITGV